jgi:tetratricopeptide (TPR) repeat protein
MSRRSIRVWVIAAALAGVAVGTALHFGFRISELGSSNSFRNPKSEIRNPRRSVADQQIRRAEAKIKQLPDNATFYAELAAAFMLKARESGDGGYYVRAEAACKKALELDPKNFEALRIVAWVYNGQHRFADARDAARRVLAEDAQDPMSWGNLGDAHIELGEYEEAAAAIQKMVDLRPDASSYTRAAYIRELYGDPDGAIRIMSMAVNAVSSRDLEHYAWCRTQLGNLYFNTGKLAEAETQYTTALEIFPDYHYALTALGRVRAAQKKADDAIQLFERSLAVVPTHDAAVALGDVLSSLRRTEQAREAFALLDMIEQVNQANQVQPEAQMALFYADHDERLDEALRIAEEHARAGQSVRTMDTLAWALYKNGRYEEAHEAIKKALRLGTKEAMFYYHAGMIQARLGRQKEAVASLKRALEINPYFHPRQAEEAHATLETLMAKQSGGPQSKTNDQKSVVRVSSSGVPATDD